MHEYYKILKAGDEVQCTPAPNPNPNGQTSEYLGGAGYKPNKTFIIQRIDHYDQYKVFWPVGEHMGVYHTSIVNPMLHQQLNYEIY